jgi:hypothetical protein
LHHSPLKETYAFGDYLAWTLFAAIPVLTAIHAISRVSIAWSVIYIIVLGVCFAAVLYRFFCTHCPHYANRGGKTYCLFLWGFPAYFKPREGPLLPHEKLLTALAFLVVVAFPIYWLLAAPILLLVYIISWGAIVAFMRKYECIRCIYRHCPMNQAQIHQESGKATAP